MEGWKAELALSVIVAFFSRTISLQSTILKLNAVGHVSLIDWLISGVGGNTTVVDAFNRKSSPGESRQEATTTISKPWWLEFTISSISVGGRISSCSSN